MNKLKIFFRTFVKSLTSPKYYRDVLKAKFSFSLKYLVLLLFLVNLIITVKIGIFVYKYYPKAAPFVAEVKQVVVDFYPKELILTIKKQKISTNVKEPYYIDFPKQIAEPVSKVYKHLIVIDTKGKVDDYSKYSSVILVTADKMVTPDDQNKGNYQIIPLADKLAEVPDGTKVDKKLYDVGIQKILPYFDRVAKWIYILVLAGLILLPFAATGFGLLGKLFYLLWTTVLLWLLVKILKKKLDYSEIYRLGIHGLTLPIVVNSGLILLGIHLPLIYSLIFFVWMVVVLIKIRE